MSNIEGSAQEALKQVQAIVEKYVPDAHCELRDYQHRIGCGAPDEDGNIVDVFMLRRGLDEEQVEALARILAQKVAANAEKDDKRWRESLQPLPNKNRVV